MAISRYVSDAHLSLYNHFEALGLKLVMSKYQLSRVNSYISLEENATSDRTYLKKSLNEQGVLGKWKLFHGLKSRNFASFCELLKI